MRILALRPEPPGGPIVAYFDASITDDVTIFDLALRRPSDGGTLVVYPPKGRRSGCSVAAIAPALRSRLRDMAILAIQNGGLAPHERHHAA